MSFAPQPVGKEICAEIGETCVVHFAPMLIQSEILADSLAASIPLPR